MPSQKLIAIVTALTALSGAQGAYAAASAEQLVTIESLIVARNCVGLRNYLDQYPVLLEGTDPLASELRNFASGIDSGLISCLSFRSSPAAPGTAVAATRSGTGPGTIGPNLGTIGTNLGAIETDLGGRIY